LGVKTFDNSKYSTPLITDIADPPQHGGPKSVGLILFNEG
jgi:hypothetical protein